MHVNKRAPRPGTEIIRACSVSTVTGTESILWLTEPTRNSVLVHFTCSFVSCKGLYMELLGLVQTQDDAGIPGWGHGLLRQVLV